MYVLSAISELLFKRIFYGLAHLGLPDSRFNLWCLRLHIHPNPALLRARSEGNTAGMETQWDCASVDGNKDTRRVGTSAQHLDPTKINLESNLQYDCFSSVHNKKSRENTF